MSFLIFLSLFFSRHGREFANFVTKTQLGFTSEHQQGISEILFWNHTNSRDGGCNIVIVKTCESCEHMGDVSRKSRNPFGPEKPFLINRYLKTEVYSAETSPMERTSVHIKNI